MQLSSKPVAFFLLLVTVALPVIAQASPFVSASAAAGCDEHNGNPPSQPVSFICCQGGHDTAVVQRAFSVDRCLSQLSLTSNFLSPASAAEPSMVFQPVSSGSPPALVRLRV